MNIIVLGKQGVGKGVSASFLAKKLKVPVISVGQLLRKKAKKDKKIAKRLESGKLVPARQAVRLALARLQKKDCQKGWVLDGFPRDMEQLKLLHGRLRIDLVLEMHAPDKELMERIAGRRICKKFGHVYHLKSLKPKRAGICDYDGSDLYQREDDQPKAIRERWREFEKETVPVMKFLEKHYNFKRVNANAEIKIVNQRVWKAVTC
ncbi:MAG: nucleoside monophosphate kinase [Candidatus Diapherotrites archaeon]